MSYIYDLDKITSFNNLVLIDTEIAKKAHKELFSFTDESYLDLDKESLLDNIERLFESLNNYSKLPTVNLHLVLNWLNLLKVSSWNSEVSSSDHLKVIFTSIDELGDDFNYENLDEAFQVFFKNRRFDILRKFCHLAKNQLDKKLNYKGINTFCHLYSLEIKRIIASSL
ncbi:MAG: hypothetical protein N3A59_01355 [Thermodesulfovibrionales bacterium]|nr:hypothetical protein [Thermodesulfovibrionales bacterium]